MKTIHLYARRIWQLLFLATAAYILATTGCGGDEAGGAAGASGTAGIPVAAGNSGTAGAAGTAGNIAPMDGSAAGAPGDDAGVADAPIAPPDAATDLPVLPSDTRPAQPDVPGDADAGAAGGCSPAGWNRTFDVSSLSGLAVHGDGTLVAAVKLFDTQDFGSGPVTSAGSADVAIVKLNPADGKAMWMKSFGDGSDQMPGRIALSKSGHVGMLGTFTGTLTIKNSIVNSAPDAIDFLAALDADGNGLWAKAVDTKGGGFLAIASHPAQDAFAVCGYAMGAATDLVAGATAAADEQEDVLIAKIDAGTGAVIWSRQFANPGSQQCTSIALDALGDVYAAGLYNGTLDLGAGPLPLAPGKNAQAIWVAKLDGASGSTKSAASWGNDRRQSLKALSVDDAGNLALVGGLRDTMTFGAVTLPGGGGPGADAGATTTSNSDAFALKLDGKLVPVWARRWGDTANQELRAAAFDSAGDLVVAGSLVGSMDMGGGMILTAATGADYYMNPQPDPFWAKLSGATGATLCAQRFGDDHPQSADLLVLARSASGSQANAVTVSGNFQGTIDFGLGQLVASGKQSGTSVLMSAYLLQVRP